MSLPLRVSCLPSAMLQRTRSLSPPHRAIFNIILSVPPSAMIMVLIITRSSQNILPIIASSSGLYSAHLQRFGYGIVPLMHVCRQIMLALSLLILPVPVFLPILITAIQGDMTSILMVLSLLLVAAAITPMLVLL